MSVIAEHSSHERHAAVSVAWPNTLLCPVTALRRRLGSNVTIYGVLPLLNRLQYLVLEGVAASKTISQEARHAHASGLPVLHSTVTIAITTRS